MDIVKLTEHIPLKSQLYNPQLAQFLTFFYLFLTLFAHVPQSNTPKHIS